MSKTTKSAKMELTVQTSTPTVLEVLQAELNKLQAINDSPFKTNGKLDGIADIKKEMNVRNLHIALATLSARERHYNEGQAEITAEIPDYQAEVFKWEGNTKEEWKHDIILQIKRATHKARYDEIKGLMEEAKEFMSQDERKQMFMSKLNAKLGTTNVSEMEA